VSFNYSVFGLTVRSSAFVPGLTLTQGPEELPDVELFLACSPESREATYTESVVYTSSYTGPTGTPALQIWRNGPTGLFHLVYFDGIQFWMDQHGTKLWASWPSESSVEEAATYLLGPVLGLLLRFRGVTCLHASAIAIDDSVIAFVGSEGAGKSTTAAAFARVGYAVVSDDVVALAERGEGFLVSPAYPQVCLWPESVKILYGSADALPPLTPNWEKRRLALGNGELRFQETALPLRAIYLLDDLRGTPGSHVEGIAPQEGFLSLVANSYATNMLDSEMRAKEFKTLSDLVSRVPIRRLLTSRRQLPPGDLCRVVLRDFASPSSRP
jgi:hypothetical protein